MIEHSRMTFEELDSFLKDKTNVKLLAEFLKFSGELQHLFDQKWTNFLYKPDSVRGEAILKKMWEDYVQNELGLEITGSTDKFQEVTPILNPSNNETKSPKEYILIPKEFAIKALTLKALP